MSVACSSPIRAGLLASVRAWASYHGIASQVLGIHLFESMFASLLGDIMIMIVAIA